MRCASTVAPAPRSRSSRATTTFDLALAAIDSAKRGCGVVNFAALPAHKKAAPERDSLRKSRRLPLRVALICVPPCLAGSIALINIYGNSA